MATLRLCSRSRRSGAVRSKDARTVPQAQVISVHDTILICFLRSRILGKTCGCNKNARSFATTVERCFAMTNALCDGQSTANCDQYQALLAVSEAIASHRDLESLFRELAGALHNVVRFDYLVLILHDAARDSLREHVLEPADPKLLSWVQQAGLAEDSPSRGVWETQEPYIVPNFAELERWPRLVEFARSIGLQSSCELPLTTARRRLGTLIFACKELSGYDPANGCFLKLVANQVAVAVENALAFDEIGALKEELAKENAHLEKEVAYLADEFRTEHNFGEIIGKNTALREILSKVETVAPTESTVLVYGETGTGKELIA